MTSQMIREVGICVRDVLLDGREVEGRPFRGSLKWKPALDNKLFQMICEVRDGLSDGPLGSIKFIPVSGMTSQRVHEVGTCIRDDLPEGH